MNKRPFFLITNDDGIIAPGIRHLWESVCEFADVAIVAPNRERSGAGVSITWTKPLTIHPFAWDGKTAAWSVSGTPADCVKMACNALLERPPQMILSGINRGSNAGRTVLYSGTVGAIIEGVLKNIPGIAFSYCDFTPPPLSAVKEYIASIVHHFFENPLPSGTFLNVNFPTDSANGIKGVRLAKQGKGFWTESPEKRIHPEGAPYYWLGGKWKAIEGEDPESDVAFLEEKYITAVPIEISTLTNNAAFQERKDSFRALFEERKNLVTYSSIVVE